MSKQSQQCSLPDVQNGPDTRNIFLSRVGIENVKFPIYIFDGTKRKTMFTQSLFDMYTSLQSTVKGINMSRFQTTLNNVMKSCGYRFDSSTMKRLLIQLAKNMNSIDAFIRSRFTYFILRTSPVSNLKGMMGYEIILEGKIRRCGNTVDKSQSFIYQEMMEIVVPITTLCPCSKEISENSAHNQRAYVRVSVIVKPDTDAPRFERIIDMVEQCGSCKLYPILKRVDEKYVTEHAYNHPQFVEDVTRDVATLLKVHPDIAGFKIKTTSIESIHDHDAVAFYSHQWDW